MPGFSEKRITGLLAGVSVSSLDAPILCSGDGASRLDYLPARADTRPDRIVEADLTAKGIRAAVDAAIERLSPRAAQIVRMKLIDELDGQEIGDRLGVTRQAVALSLKQSLPRLQAAIQSNPFVVEALIS